MMPVRLVGWSVRGSSQWQGMRDVILVVALATMLSLSGCVIYLPIIHYRLTVTVDTPEGRVSGSSVLEYKSDYSPGFPFPAAEGFRSHVRGEATPVRLPNGKYIFALLKWDDSDDTAALDDMLTASFAGLLPAVTGPDGEELRRQKIAQIGALAKLRTSRPIAPGHYPALAYFDDPLKPSTIHAVLVRPGETIAPQIRLVGMTLEITDAPVTHQILSILPWMLCRKSGYLDPRVGNYSIYKDSDAPVIDKYRLIDSGNIIRGLRDGQQIDGRGTCS